jgi:HEAT repeat protein
MTNSDSIIQLLRSFTVRHDPWRVEDALDALTVVPDGHVTGLTQALADEDDELRLLAIGVLGWMEVEAELALPTMIETLRDPERIVRIAAVDPVSAFGYKAKAAIPILETWLHTVDEFSQVTAAAAIMTIDQSRDDVLPVLVDALGSDDVGIRCHAASHLGGLGAVSREAVPALRRMLDEEPSIRRFAAEAIASITGE